MRSVHTAPATPALPLASFADLQTHLDSLGLFRMQPGLDRIAAVLERLRLKRPPFAVVQVAGTNGKGSTSTMLASLAQAHGLRVGLHTSPHFLSVRERIRVNGGMPGEATWLTLANRLLAAGGGCLSYFELVTVLAVMAFAEAKVHLAVMETGLGGSFDATTALEADLVVFTPFGLDHQAVLGPTLRDIARDKAGAIRQECPVVSAPQAPEAREEILRAARERQAPVLWLDSAWTGLTADLCLRLTGAHQKNNAALALAGWRRLRAFFGSAWGLEGETDGQGEGLPAPLTAREAAGLAAAHLPGRLQFVPPLAAAPPPPVNISAAPAGSGPKPPFMPSPLGWPALLLDGAHNTHAFAALGPALAGLEVKPGAVVFSCLEDKDPAELAPFLRALTNGPIFVPPVADNPRAMDPKALAVLIGPRAVPTPSLAEALRLAAAHMAERLPEAFAQSLPAPPRTKAPNSPAARGPCTHPPARPLLVCGSLYLLGQFYALRPDCLEA